MLLAVDSGGSISNIAQWESNVDIGSIPIVANRFEVQVWIAMNSDSGISPR